MHYAIAASPLSKLFLTSKTFVTKETEGLDRSEWQYESWQDRCMADPKIILDDSIPFEMNVRNSTTGTVFKYGVPQMIVSHPENTQNKKEHFERAEDYVNWLVGGKRGIESQETDMYGIVLVKIPFDVMAETDKMNQLLWQAQLETDPEKKEKLFAAQRTMGMRMMKAMMGAKEDARRRADQKVMRVLRTTHRNLLVQWQKNAESNMGRYTPSEVEQLGAIILKDENAKKNDARRVANDQFREIAQDMRAF